MKQISKYLILTVLALTLMGGAAVAYAHDGSGPMNGPGGPGRGIGGEVTAIDGNTISVENPRGTGGIVTDDSTEFTVNGETGDLSQVQVGMFVFARGERSEDGTVTATQVVASSEAPQRPNKDGEGRDGRFGRGAGGEVTAIEGSTIKATNPRGEVSIVTNGDTKFTVNGEAGDIGDISEGMFVRAKGEVSEDGSSVTATRVLATDEQPERPSDEGQRQGPGPGGRQNRA